MKKLLPNLMNVNQFLVWLKTFGTGTNVYQFWGPVEGQGINSLTTIVPIEVIFVGPIQMLDGNSIVQR